MMWQKYYTGQEHILIWDGLICVPWGIFDADVKDIVFLAQQVLQIFSFFWLFLSLTYKNLHNRILPRIVIYSYDDS